MDEDRKTNETPAPAAPEAEATTESPAAPTEAAAAPATAEPAADAPVETSAEAPTETPAEPAADTPAEAPEAGAPAAAEATDPEADRGRRAPKARGGIPVGIVHIRATFNNTTVSITDVRGNVISWCTGGRAGFKGSRKSTAFAATTVAQDAARQAVAKGLHEVEVRVQGAGSGRESAIRALQSAGLTVTMIKDVTPMPHNGCRARKRRRV